MVWWWRLGVVLRGEEAAVIVPGMVWIDFVFSMGEALALVAGGMGRGRPQVDGLFYLLVGYGSVHGFTISLFAVVTAPSP